MTTKARDREAAASRLARRKWIVVGVAALLFAAAACVSEASLVQEPEKPGETGPKKSVVSLSSGGGKGATGRYRVRLVVGAMSPGGSGQTGGYSVRLGAGHAQHGQQ